MTGINLTDARQLRQKVLGQLQHLGSFQVFLLDNLLVQENLVLVIGLYILCRTVHRAQIHVQQVCRTVDIDLSGRNVVSLVLVFLLFLCSGGACQDKEYTVL